MVERGVILAGGTGSRIANLTGGGNKQAINVEGQPMIHYPLDNLWNMGISKATIVSSPEGIEELRSVIDFPDIDIEYATQPQPNGMADALGCAAVKESLFVVLCGDCYHDQTPDLDGNVQLWWTNQEAGNGGAVWDPRINRIIEKPDKSGLAIIGARVYDQTALELIKDLQPSSRGELELVDIDNYYLANGLEMSHYSGFFGDMGTLDGLTRVIRHIREN